jgi:hypothetical protein
MARPYHEYPPGFVLSPPCEAALNFAKIFEEEEPEPPHSFDCRTYVMLLDARLGAECSEFSVSSAPMDMTIDQFAYAGGVIAAVFKSNDTGAGVGGEAAHRGFRAMKSNQRRCTCEAPRAGVERRRHWIPPARIDGSRLPSGRSAGAKLLPRSAHSERPLPARRGSRLQTRSM